MVRWLEAAGGAAARPDRTPSRLAGVVTDTAATVFSMRFVDRVIRPEDPAVAACQLATLVAEAQLPGFLSPLDRLLLRVGARLGPRLPRMVMPIAQRRMRALVGHLVVDSEPQRLAKHLQARAAQGYSLNVNMLGEAVLGDAEARWRHQEMLKTLAQPDVDYVSVKVSAVVSQLNPWDFEGSLHRVVKALRPLLRAAAAPSPPKFINLDMEVYHDLELTAAAFRALLEEPEFDAVDAGIALQAYLPDCFDALRDLVDWHNEQAAAGRRRDSIKIRLVKGVGAGNSAVVVDVPRCGPMLSPRVSHHVPLVGCAGSPCCALAPLEGPRDHRVAPPARCATPASRPTRTHRRRPQLARSDSGRAAATEPSRVAGHPRHAVALAPAPHRPALDPTTATTGPTVDLSRAAPTHTASRS